MRGYWQTPSGLACDPRWPRLSGCARGLLLSLLDAADGPGEIALHGMSPADVASAVLHGDPAALEALEALEQLRFVHVDEDLDVMAVRLPRPNVAMPPRPSVAAPAGDDQEHEHDPQKARATLRAHFANRKLKTVEARSEWLGSEDGARILARLGMTLDEAQTMASRTGTNAGHFGTSVRSQAPVASEPQDGRKLAAARSQAPVASPLPSHTLPSEKKGIEREGDGRKPPPQDGRKLAADTVASPGRKLAAASPDRDSTDTGAWDTLQDALVKSSAGKLDLLSAPAMSLRVLRSLLSEMRVDVDLARVMGELAANPPAVWPYMRDPSRVTVLYLLGKVDNNGAYAAGPLVELVSQARAEIEKRRESAPVPRAARASQNTTRPITEAEAQEALRLMRERRAALPPPSSTPATTTTPAEEQSTHAA